MEEKFSEFTPQDTPSLSDEVVGLSGGDNARFTLDAINELFQAQITEVSPLPAGSPASVMYYDEDTTKWGASSNVKTDGNVLAIGKNTVNESSLLDIENYNDSYDLLINAYTKNASDEIKKLLAYTNNGIFFVTEGSVPANIDLPYNSASYGMFVEKQIIANGGIVLKDDGDSRIQFGEINGIDGSFTPSGTMYGISGVMKHISTAHVTYIESENNNNIMTRCSLNGTANLKRFDIGSDYPIQNWNALVGSNHGTIWGMESIEANSSYIGKVSIGKKSGGAYMTIADAETPASVGPSNLILFVDPSGKICMKLPITAGGSPTGVLKQLWNDGGVLKLSDY